MAQILMTTELINLIIFFNYFTHCKFFTPALTCSLNGIWVIASLLRYPGFFWVFKQILTILLFAWLQFFLWFLILPGVWGPLQGHQLQLVSPSFSSSTAFSAHWQDWSTCLYFCFLSFSLCGPLEWKNPLDDFLNYHYYYCCCSWRRIIFGSFFLFQLL